MSRAAALREHDDTPNADHIVILHNVSWEDYERVLGIRGDKSAPRIQYLEGELEIMSPSKDHSRSNPSSDVFSRPGVSTGASKSCPSAAGL